MNVSVPLAVCVYVSVPSAWLKQGTRGPSRAGGWCWLLLGTWWPWLRCPFPWQGWPEPLLHGKAREERSGSAAFPGAGLATTQRLCDANVGSAEVIANAASQRRTGSAALRERLCQAQQHALTHLQHHPSDRRCFGVNLGGFESLSCPGSSCKCLPVALGLPVPAAAPLVGLHSQDALQSDSDDLRWQEDVTVKFLNETKILSKKRASWYRKRV